MIKWLKTVHFKPQRTFISVSDFMFYIITVNTHLIANTKTMTDIITPVVKHKKYSKSII